MAIRDDITAAVITQASQISGQPLKISSVEEAVEVHLDPQGRVQLVQVLPSLIETHVNVRDAITEAELSSDPDISFDDVIHYASYLAGDETFPRPKK